MNLFDFLSLCFRIPEIYIYMFYVKKSVFNRNKQKITIDKMLDNKKEIQKEQKEETPYS